MLSKHVLRDQDCSPEFRVLAAISEESRPREQALRRKQQTRESASAELERRLRSLLNEERVYSAGLSEEAVATWPVCRDLLGAVCPLRLSRPVTWTVSLF